MCRPTVRPWKQIEQVKKLTVYPYWLFIAVHQICYQIAQTKSQGIYMCCHLGITTRERLIIPFIHHYHSTFKIHLNDNNYKYKTCLWFKFYAWDKSQLSIIIFLCTEKHGLMATFPDEHNFLLLRTFAVKHHFIISSYCLLHGNWGWQMAWVSKNGKLCF